MPTTLTRKARRAIGARIYTASAVGDRVEVARLCALLGVDYVPSTGTRQEGK